MEAENGKKVRSERINNKNRKQHTERIGPPEEIEKGINSANAKLAKQFFVSNANRIFTQLGRKVPPNKKLYSYAHGFSSHIIAIRSGHFHTIKPSELENLMKDYIISENIG